MNIPTKTTHYDVLDGLRGIAAFAVMFCHFLKPTDTQLFPNAGLAVDFFFILSGFVIMHAYGKRLRGGMPTREYLCRRVIRLYPLFLIGLIIGTPVLIWLTQTGFSTYSYSQIAASLPVNIAFLPFPTHEGVFNLGVSRKTFGEIFPSNPPAWSLFFEMIASFAFVFLLKLKRRALIGGIVFCYGLLLLGKGELGGSMSAYFWSGFPRVMFGFMLGNLIYLLSTDTKYTEKLQVFVKRYVRFSYVPYVLLIGIFAMSLPAYAITAYQMMVIALLAPILVAAASKIKPKGTEQRIAKTLGWLSYPVYCLHFPVGRAVFLAGKDSGLSQMALMTIASLLTIAVAVVLTKFIEEPARRLLSKKILPKMIR